MRFFFGVEVICEAAADEKSPDPRPVPFLLFLLGERLPADGLDRVLRSNKTSRDKSQSHDWDENIISEDGDATLRLTADFDFDQPCRPGGRTIIPKSRFRAQSLPRLRVFHASDSFAQYHSKSTFALLSTSFHFWSDRLIAENGDPMQLRTTNKGVKETP